ncbi:MAG: MG2 domain-containing protein [Candidatus Aminicenantes bacterium]|nr:MG2 domain-containing protein [Candidatus Aminicenantes bacterium]
MGHKKSGLVAFFLAVVLALITIPGCRRKKAETPSEKAAGAGEIRGELGVLSATPQGEIPTAAESQVIVVIFDRPMAALEALPEGPGSSFLEIEPQVAGKHRWLGTRALAFTPDRRLPFATEFRVTVPAGTRSPDGFVLSREFSWTFETPRPRLVRTAPRDEQENLRLDTEVLLVFNQPVSKDKAEKFVSLLETFDGGREHRLGLTFRHPSAELLRKEEVKAAPAEVLILKPSEALRPGAEYRVDVEAGLPGEEGPLGSKDGTAFSFSTFKPFAFLGLKTEGEEHNPHEALRLNFSNPVIYKNIAAAIRFEPEIEIPDLYSDWDHGSSTIWLNLPLQPETEYAVTIRASLEDEFGNALGREARLRFRTGPYPPSISFTTGHGVVEAYGDLKYPVSAVNITSVRLMAAPVDPAEVIPFLAKPNVFWGEKAVAAESGFFKVDRPLPIDGPPNESRAVPIDLSELLTEGFGFVYLQLDTERKGGWDRYQRAFLQVTSLGLSAKFSPDGNLIWVTELRTGQPVAGATVEVRSDKNTVLWRGRTDEAGRAQTPGWRKFGLRAEDEWSKPRQWIFARRGPDRAFFSSDWNEDLNPYRFGVNYEWSAEPEVVGGEVFTERGIYRAGETVHVKGILRLKEKGQWRLPETDAVRCEVNDPYERPFFKTDARLDEFGSFAFDIEVPEDAPLGSYRLTTRVPPDRPGGKEETVVESFRVEAFRPAEFEVNLRSGQPAYVFGDEYRGELRATYLSGGPLAGQSASWHLRLNPASVSPPGFKGYIFGNEIDWDESGAGEERSRLLASGQGRLDERGYLEVRAPLKADKERDTMRATLEATVTSPSRKSITSRIETLVHRGDFSIGLRPATTFLSKGRELGLDIVAADPSGKTVPGRTLTAKLVRREWRSVRKAGVGGRFEWLTEREDVEVATQKVESAASPVSVAFKPEKSGLYLLAAEGRDRRGNTVSSSTSVYVTGDDYVAWERRDDDILDLVPDAEEYRPGDRARILVKSPYEKAKALVTIEREGILDSRVIDIVGSSSQVEVPLDSGHIPNVFVSILLVQGRTASAATEARDAGKPSFKLGYVELKVNAGEKRLRVEAVPDRSVYRPHDRVTVRLKVGDAQGQGRRTSVAVAVVDVGVLNLIGYSAPDPFDRFYSLRPLSVDTSESRIHVVGQRAYGEKGEDAGGGGTLAESPALALSQVELRGDFRSTAYWNPSVMTDERGEAEVSFELPDNLTSFRVMAVAQTRDSRFGRGDAALRVSKPLQLLPSLPRFARVGDSFEGGVVVQNFSPRAGRVEVSVEAQGIACSDATPRAFVLKAGESREALFPFTVGNAGEARLAFRARLNEDRDGLEAVLPVFLPRPTEDVALFDQTAEAPKTETVRIPENVYPAETRLEVQASATALSGLAEGLGYLRDYPYLCLEQRLSAILPYLVGRQVIEDFGLSPMSPDETSEFVAGVLEEIGSYQKDEGGFGLWTDSRRPSPYATCYAVFALLKARAAGYDINRYSLDQGLQYLRNLLREKKPSGRYPYSLAGWKTTLAFALYDLALAGQPEAAYAERLWGDRGELTIFGRTLLLKALQLGKGSPAAHASLLQELLNLIKVSPTDAHFEESPDASLAWVYSSNVRTTALVVQALVEIGQDHPLLPGMVRWLVSKRQAGRWASTQENFYVFYALNEYYRVYERERPDFRFKISLATRTLIEDAFRETGREVKSAGLSLADLRPGASLPLTIAKDGPGRLYYGARLTYAPAGRLAPREEGLAVFKRLSTLDGRPLASVKAGSLVVVTLEVVLPRESLYVVVEDPLPAGFEAVNPTFLTESAEAQRTLERLDEEEDIRWWEGFSHVEMHDDRVLLFADSLTAGLRTHRYLARALNPGVFQVPGTKVEEMYAPEVFGRTAEQSVRIER